MGAYSRLGAFLTFPIKGSPLIRGGCLFQVVPLIEINTVADFFFFFHANYRLKAANQLVDHPVRKGELSSTELRHKTMADRLVEFSLGPVRNMALFSK